VGGTIDVDGTSPGASSGGTDSGCGAGRDASPGGLALCLFFGLMLLWRRRRHRSADLVGGVLVCMLFVTLTGPQAHAAGTGFIADGFEALPAHHRNHIVVSTSDILAHGDGSTSLVMSQAKNILSAGDLQVGGIEALSYPIEGQLRTEILAAYGLFDLMDIGVAIPVLAYQWGDDLGGIDRAGEEVDGTVLGDVRIHPRIRFVRRLFTFLPVTRARSTPRASFGPSRG